MKARKVLRYLISFLAAALLLVVAVCYFGFALPFWGMPFSVIRQHKARPPITPPWALECWLWEDDHNTAAYTLELLDGYVAHDFPVRTILIDSPWSTRYNDFCVDEKRYPNPSEFFATLDKRGYRVVLWMTCMVNRESDDTAIVDSSDWFEQARSNGYLAGEEICSWWKGKGGFIDYTNPAAMKWWRGLQQQVFDWGVDGWKLDGAETYFFTRIGPVPVPYRKTHEGLMTTRGYADHYYRDEYRHGLTRNPEFVTLARSLDSPVPYAHPEGFAPIDASPVNWVGDNRHVWDDKNRGLERALWCILESAKMGYNVIGSDVAGYHGSMDIPANLYIRWAQFSAFCGLFLNGGHGERALWKRSQPELEIVRKFAWLHTELVPYMYSHVVMCHEGGDPLMRPFGDDYHYRLGNDLLVAPIHEDKLARTVTLPEGRWRYWFDDAEGIDGPATITRDFPLDEYPVYVRDGAIIPLNVSRDYTGFGARDSEGFLTLAIYPNGKNAFTVHHPDGSGSTTISVAAANDIEITLDGVKKPHILRVLLEREPREITLDGQTLEKNAAWRYDPAAQRLWITTRAYTQGRYRIAAARD